MRPQIATMENSPGVSQAWRDVSVPIYTGMVHYPANPPIEIARFSDVGRGDICTNSRITMGSHTGTHIDAPIHFVPGGTGAEDTLLDNLIGPVRVIEINDRRAVRAEELQKHKLGQRDRLLFKTSNSERCWKTSEFVKDFIAIAEDAASLLAGLNTLAVGIDYLSAGSPETHRTLLGAGVVIIEGVNLSGVPPGCYQMLCLPLLILGGDGAPARVLLKDFDGNATEENKDQLGDGR